MKKFTQFSAFFSLFLSSFISLIYFISGVGNFIDYIKSTNELEESLYLLSCGKNFITAFLVLAIGFAVTSIIWLLIKIANNTSEIKRDEKTE